MSATALETKFENAEQLVAFCLKNFPETRGNDRELILQVWNLQGFRIPKKLLPLYYKVFSPETIRRSRQSIQAGGLYLSNPLTTAKRSLFAMEHRDYWSKVKSI